MKERMICLLYSFLVALCVGFLLIMSHQHWQNRFSPDQSIHQHMESVMVDSEKNLSRIFVLALGYREHLTMAMWNLFSLVHVAREWGAHPVVPFTRESELFGLPSRNRMAFNLLFDTDEINSQLLSKKYGLPSLVEFKDFMHLADRKIVFVQIVWSERAHGVDFMRKKVIECSKFTFSQDAGKKLVRTLNDEAKQLEVSEFSIVYYCCINPYIALTAKEIAESCRFADTTSTVVVDDWKGHRDHVLLDNYRLMLPDLKLSAQPNGPVDYFPCSKGVRLNATAFTQSFSEGKDFIAFHIRTAKIGMRGQNYTDACMEKIFGIRDSLTNLYPDLAIKYFVDYGEHGMKVGVETKNRKLVVKHTEDNRIVPLHYDPAQFGGLSDEGFVSLVEKSAIAKAKVLVLLGGGSFQRELALRARHESKSEKIYCVCTGNPKSPPCDSDIFFLQ